MEKPSDDLTNSSLPRYPGEAAPQAAPAESADEPKSHALSPIDIPSRELVIAGESLWARLAAVKALPDSHDTRIALRSTYSSLAAHYAMFGGDEAAVRFLKNALAYGEDPELRHQLARLQARTPGFDFIVSFTKLLTNRQYNLKLTLEYCYFLEQKGLHAAALGVLETELAKRLKISPSAEIDADAPTTLDGFLRLLQSNISIERQVHLQDYRDLFSVSFPDSVFSGSSVDEEMPEETLVGQTLEEFEQDHGLFDEAKHLVSLAYFAAQHYATPLLTAAGAMVLILLSIFRLPQPNIEFVGIALLLLLGAFFLYELLRSVRLPPARRLREQNKIARNVSFVALTMLILNWLGPKIFGRGEGGFFPFVAIKFVSAVLVVAVLWQVHANMAAIRKSLRRIREGVVAKLERAAFRRQVAGIIRTTAGWALLFTFASSLTLMSRASAELALYGGLQALYLLLVWRWGVYEARAEKQRMRDEIALLIATTFIALVALELYLETPPWIVVTSLSFAGFLLLSIVVCYGLQLTDLRPSVFSAFAAPLLFLNFAPALHEWGWLHATDQVLEEFLPGVTLGTRVLLVLALVLAVPLLRRRRVLLAQMQIVQGDVYMKPKYEFHGGQFGAVGDQASATHFTQVNQQGSEKLDLQALALELAQLKAELVARAEQPEHYVAIAQVAAAEQAAAKGEQDEALASLKNAGAWVWDVATKVGVGVAIVAAKQFLGL